MNRTTLLMGILAAGSLTGAVAMRPVSAPPPVFEDTGEALFESFTDPTVAANLEVREWDEEGARLKNFNVKIENGSWVIPSHHNYRADGTERMAKAAASFVGVKKDIVRSNLAEDHAEFGVLDAEDIEADAAGKGQRVIIQDASGTILVDILVGKEVPEKKGYRFVRYPDKDRVYAVKMELDISTDFTDWIEQDLLDFDRDKTLRVLSDAYRVDEKSKQVVDRHRMHFEFLPEEESSDKKEWQAASGTNIPGGKELNPSKVRQILGAIDRLKIVGVRPRPAVLRDLVDTEKGFFLSRGRVPKLYGNEGELSVFQDDGVVYTFYFGEITHETGLALTAGSTASPNPEAGEDADESKANRYLLIQIGYSDADATSAPEAEDEGDKDKAEDKEEKLHGMPRAESLHKRYDKWFYVISNSSFKQLRKETDDFLRDKKGK